MDFICQENGFFKNPTKSPLNELVLEIKQCKKIKKRSGDKDLDRYKDDLKKYYDIHIERIPALDPMWIQKNRSYHNYQPYYSEVTAEENEFFLSKNKLFLQDLKFLLECTYHQFWCYIIYEPKVLKLLESFIMNAVNWYEIKHLQGEYLEIYNKIYDCTGRIVLRLLSFYETEEEFMLPATAFKYLDQLNFFTCANIINLCLLYNNSNKKILNKIMNILFAEKRKSKYSVELKHIMDHILLVFEMVGGQICGFEENASIVPFAIRPKPSKFDPYWVEETVTYLLDTAASLNAFLSNCKTAVGMGLNMGIPYRLSYFYNRVYEELYKLVKVETKLPYDWSKLKLRIYEHIALGRFEFVNAFHVFVAHLIDNIVQSQGHIELQSDYVEQYFKLISSAIEDEFFICDYQSSNEIDVQLQMISEFCPEFDHMRSNYILECLSNIPKMKGVSTKNIEKPIIKLINPVPGTSGTSFNNIVDKKDTKKIPDEKEIEELIGNVLETLPHLGDGFILKCLEAYNYDPSEVISAVLDENLPPHLSDISHDMIRIPPEPQAEEPILAYTGKKPSYKNANQLLDDKTDLNDIKNFVLKSSNISYDIYDDEYDDRYENEPAIHLYERSEETDLYKYMENRFDGYELVSDPSSTDEENDTNQTPINKENKTNKSSGAWCEDPAVLRARKEAQKTQYASKPRGNDLTGKPKGQGQSKDVLQNRNKKNVNKSSRANHNRKSGAQWKRNKGMLPS